MARGRAKPPEDNPISPVMLRHMHALKCWSISRYFDWCSEHGVEPSLVKTTKERESELALPDLRRKALLARARTLQNPQRFIEMACRDEIDPDEVSRFEWQNVVRAISRSKKEDRESLSAFLLLMNKASNLVFAEANLKRMTAPYALGLVRLNERRKQWIRPIEAWKAPSHNVGRQFASLSRHLFARYEVPAFMDSAWLRSDAGAYRFRDWYVHLGEGKNIRAAKTPYAMTRMMAHHFTAAPADYSIEGALMLADIRALGGGPRLAEALMATRLGLKVEKDEDKRKFWLSVYRFFIDNPMMDLRHAGPVVDFLVFHKFESQDVMTEPGVVEVRPPPQPNLSMSRRTPDSLLRQVEAWHGDLRKAKGADSRFWRASGFKGLTLVTGPRDRPEDQVMWHARELTSGQELVDEGRAMRHCVATYVDSCVRGDYSIWSLTRHEADVGVRRALTVSLDSKGVVVEARGPHNKMPSDAEWRVLETWMQASGLKQGAYLRH